MKFFAVLIVTVLALSFFPAIKALEIFPGFHINGIADAWKYGFRVGFSYKTEDSYFGCSKYDGYAACFKDDPKKRDARCQGKCITNKRWEYKHPILGGTCYCCKCD